MNNFKEMDLHPKLLGALETMTFHIPTPIQAKAIPEILSGKDLIACAQTGTGKTAAFCIPLICHLLKNREQSALILVPTRELAFQIIEVLKKHGVKEESNMLTIGLFGNCGNSKWRDRFIEKYNGLDMQFFNPQVDD